ncbi:MAG: HAD family phosphatase [Elusimicrobia bacterium]|nr:HAD family phosphatase [Elusimicrobiota bacterium]
MAEGRITVVFFDIGNVLLTFSARKVALKLAAAVRCSPWKLARVLWTSGLAEKVERGQVSPLELYHIFRWELGFQGSRKDFERAWCDHFTLNRGTAALLKRLRKTHKVYLLSNTNELHYDYISRNYSFTKQVHGAVLSHELGLRKPEPEIYRAALKKARALPAQAVFIDDLAENVDAARRAGIHAFQYTELPALRRELSRLRMIDA